MKNKNRGAITVEAALILPLFIIVILSIVSILNIFYTQAVMQQSLNVTATRLAQYSYLVKAAGIMDETSDAFNLSSETSEKATRLKSSLEAIEGSAQNITTLLSEGIRFSNVGRVAGETRAFVGSAGNLVSHLSGVTEADLLDYALSEIAGTGGSLLVGTMADAYLNDIKLNMNNVSEVTYNKSQFFHGPDKDITLIVTYKYHNPLSLKLFDEIELVQVVSVRPWIGGNDGGFDAAVKRAR